MYLDSIAALDTLIDESRCPACFGHNLSCQSVNVTQISRGHIYFGNFNSLEVVAKIPKSLASACEKITKIASEYNMKCNDVNLFKKMAVNYDNEIRAKILETTLLCPANRIYEDLSAMEIYTLLHDFSTFLSLKSHILGIESFIPKIIARCPQVVLYKNSGKDLRTFLGSSLISRYRVSYEALILAEKMSMTDSHFIFYMTDANLDNLVWTSDGRVIPVDLDDVYIVESSSQAAVKGDTSKYYTHMHENCPNDCVKFFPKGLCKYTTGGDMNYYLICKFVVNKLILYDADEDLLEILERCVADGVGRNRERHVKDLKEALLTRLTHTGISIESNFVDPADQIYKS